MKYIPFPIFPFFVLIIAKRLLLVEGIRNPLVSPNIVLYFVDDLGYGDLGFTGHPTTITPNIDRLAYGGKVLTSWYSGAAVCTASRTALLTGRQPPRVGMPGVINSLAKEGLPLNETTIADFLRSAEYKTFVAGKWHVGQGIDWLPNNRGFDEFYGLPFSVDDGTGYISPCDKSNESFSMVNLSDFDLGPQLPLPLIHQVGKTFSFILNQPTDLIPLTENLAFAARDFATRYQHYPFFLYIAFGHVHTATPNIQPNEQYSGCNFQNTTRRGRFGDALSEVDWLVGNLTKHIENLGLGANTLYIFVSDNGPWLMKGASAGSMGLFTGVSAGYPNTGKGSTWEGGIRMPAFVYWPGQIAAGTRSAEIVSTMDILPTALKLANIQTPENLVLDGKEMTDIIFDIGDAKSKHAFLPFYNGAYYGNVSRNIFAARYGAFKAHFYTSPGLVGHNISNVTQHDPPLIYNVEEDPSEAYPLQAGQYPKELLSSILMEKQKYENSLFVRAIDPSFGFQYALCCNWKTNCTCTERTPLPPPNEISQ